MDKGLLNEATSTDDTPTPGYMLSEIARKFEIGCTNRIGFIIVLGSTIASYAACTQLIEFLNARLKKNNHNVKFKCLMIIKVILLYVSLYYSCIYFRVCIITVCLPNWTV